MMKWNVYRLNLSCYSYSRIRSQMSELHLDARFIFPSFFILHFFNDSYSNPLKRFLQQLGDLLCEFERRNRKKSHGIQFILVHPNDGDYDVMYCSMTRQSRQNICVTHVFSRKTIRATAIITKMLPNIRKGKRIVRRRKITPSICVA